MSNVWLTDRCIPIGKRDATSSRLVRRVVTRRSRTDRLAMPEPKHHPRAALAAKVRTIPQMLHVQPRNQALPWNICNDTILYSLTYRADIFHAVVFRNLLPFPSSGIKGQAKEAYSFGPLHLLLDMKGVKNPIILRAPKQVPENLLLRK
jgi:hypothetical protein